MPANQNLYSRLSLFPILLCGFFLLSAGHALAAENQEISFLLAHIAASDCTFIRNGDEHSGEEASQHLLKKYRYARERIDTAEKFIAEIATKSSFSGEPYEVVCGKVSTPTKGWLTKVLDEYRDSTGH